MDKKLPYYTHAGVFHSDENAGYSICVLAGVCDRFVRLTDIKNIPQDGLIADIGREYDPIKFKFDHHQGLILRPNGYPYASAGMLWKEYGEWAVKNILGIKDHKEIEEVAARVDKKLIQGIDAHDADAQYAVTATCSAGEVDIITLPVVISTFNSADIKDAEQQDIQFELASNFMTAQIENAVRRDYDYVVAKKEFAEISEIDGKIAVLSKHIMWREIVDELHPELHFVITPSSHPGNPYSLTAVGKNLKTREVKTPIERPDWFKGFIHQGKWIAGGNSIEEMKKLAEHNLLPY